MKKEGGKPSQPLLSAFMLFAGMNRQRIWQNNANASHITIGRLIVDEWERLLPVEKDKYERLSIENEINRERARIIQIAEMEKRSGVKKRKRDPKAPKAAIVPYNFFMKEFRPQFKEQNQDASCGELGKLLGAAWRNLPEEERQIYTKMAEDDKLRFQEEMVLYQKDLGSFSEIDSLEK